MHIKMIQMKMNIRFHKRVPQNNTPKKYVAFDRSDDITNSSNHFEYVVVVDCLPPY
jgi:hypothetical protein